MFRHAVIAALLVVSALPGCGQEATPSPGVQLPADDAGAARDGGPSDTGRADTDAPDAGPTDAGRADTAAPDSAQTDSARTDSARTDSDQTDSDQTDSDQTDSDQPDTGLPAGALTLEALPDAFAQTYCDVVAGCCDARERARYFGDAFVHRSTCTSRQSRWFGSRYLAAFSWSLSHGTLVYDAEAAAGCLEAYATDGCAAFRQDTWPLCDEAFVAQVDVGGQCGHDFDCIDATCVGEQLDGQGRLVRPGQCEPKPGVGYPCADAVCSDGAFCDGRTSDGGERVCHAQKSDGNTCRSAAECRSDHCEDPGQPDEPGTCGWPVGVCDGA